MAVLIIAVFASVAFFQIPRLARARKKKDIVFFSIFWLAGFILIMLFNAGVKIPGPIKIVMGLLDKIGLHY